MIVIRWLLFPFTLLHAFILWVRNKLFDYQVIKSNSFDIPTIVVGNLVVGGAGKSPMTEYLITLLKDQYKIATLSRGYGRATKGFLLADNCSSASDVGDEPLQFKQKFPEITVAVCENRSQGVEQLKDQHNLIILDDAYQHRKLKAHFNLLLFDFESLFKALLPLPTGNFRDLMGQTNRADVILITKCPEYLTKEQKSKIDKILLPYQKPIFYSKIHYLPLVATNKEFIFESLEEMDILLFTGIANPKPLISYLNNHSKSLKHIQFSDHHSFSNQDIDKIKAEFHQLESTHKIIVTTEKDFQRIKLNDFETFPLFIQPIKHIIDNDDEFNSLLLKNIDRTNNIS